MEISINPKPEQISKVLKALPHDREIVMLNLLKFNDLANYPSREDGPASGQDAYQQYGAKALPFLAKAGASIIWSGKALGTLIAPDWESWDKVMMVKYPSIQAFVSMVMDSEYQAITHHRTAALANARLIATFEDSES